jgi:NAD(P)-dependent dehydrogenase (short-subunit alcohol dehydrogenase family)
MAFAKRGACVTLAARREAVLREAAAVCEGQGGRALALPTDVGDLQAVRQLARRAIEAFGKIDVWVNNAGVGAVGAFVETPIEAHDQVVRTNLLGYLNGAHAILPHFHRARCRRADQQSDSGAFPRVASHCTKPTEFLDFLGNGMV